MKNFYITTPIYYVNDVPHIGHAYTTLACDVMASYQRLHGKQVRFLTGTDEHGQKVEKSARAKGKEPQAFTDEVSERFRALIKDPKGSGENLLGVSNDDFIRTTEARHKAGAQAFWNVLESNGYIYKDSYAGWYSVRDEAYYQESELQDGKAPTGAEVEWVEEESYFFKLSAFQDQLLAFYEANPDFVYPKSRYNEVKSFVSGGLKDLSISRTTFSWGVPVPGNDKHVMYVWLDALTNYLTALGYPDTETENYKTYWPANVHVVGKDILRFHAVYWPAFLMAATIPLPDKIVAHGWWTNEGEKISKSLGNVINPIELIEEFGLDQMRYFMFKAVPFGNDGNFARSDMINQTNADLANTIGNLVQRSLSMIQKNCDAQVPPFEGSLDAVDSSLIELGYSDSSVVQSYHDAMEHYRFHDAIKAILEIAGRANEYMDTQAPWQLKKTDPTRMQAVLYTVAETVRTLAILLQPFTPSAAGRILDQLAVAPESRDFAALQRIDALQVGVSLPKPEGVFPRYVVKEAS